MIKRSLAFLLALTILSACENGAEKAVIEEEQEESSAKFSYRILNKSVDSLQYNNPLLLDLNKDGVVDYYMTSVLLEENDEPYMYLLINRKSPNMNKVLVRKGPELVLNGLWGVPFERDFEIKDLAPDGTEWSENLTKTCLLSTRDNGQRVLWGGEWIGKKDKYLGLKFKINDKYHYGWMRISHTAGEGKLALQDYAYNKNPEESILAGQK
ncbi:hypothetical protein [Pedobacter sp. SYSU D00535]|uniref:hypothetical protein n=1 Tax=Pedobacter sp. SYSU D00535 TaxID=2810308 RepID=UPI001A961970|nr:hypothetical protein [Pedobacter sp. SYSU D00535]